MKPENTQPLQRPPVQGWVRTWAVRGTLAALCAGCLMVIGQSQFTRWQSDRHLERARAAAAAGDLPAAAKACQSACLANPDNGEAARLMAELGQRLPPPLRMSWARQWVQAQPESVPARMQLVKLLAAGGDFDSARAQLEAIPGWDGPDPGLQALAGTLALARNDFTTARHHARKALALAPDDPVLQLNLIVALHRGGNVLEQAEALERLRHLEAHPETRPAALRTRVSLQRDLLLLSEAIETCRLLVRENPGSPEDRLVLVELLKAAGKAEWTRELATLRAQVERLDRPGPFIGVAQWLQKQGLHTELCAWLEASPRTAPHPTLQRLLAESLMATGRWDEILRRFSDGTWEMQDIFREAIVARAHRQLGAESSCQSHWIRARRQALDNPIVGEGLTRYMQHWGPWQTERIELLWALSVKPEVARPVVESLEAHYHALGHAEGLWRSSRLRMAIDPDNELNASNYAMYALLLGKDERQGHAIAQRLHRKYPDKHLPISTFAFSLRQQGKPAEALTHFQKLPPHIRRTPIFSGYYGLLLAEAGGDKNEAASLLRSRLSHPATDVERDLFTSALARVTSE